MGFESDGLQQLGKCKGKHSQRWQEWERIDTKNGYDGVIDIDKSVRKTGGQEGKVSYFLKVQFTNIMQ